MEIGELSPTTDAREQQLSETAALRVIGVTKSFPGVRALSSANFDCREGEVHALVGENGSGKSTMIKAASGVRSSLVARNWAAGACSAHVVWG